MMTLAALALGSAAMPAAAQAQVPEMAVEIDAVAVTTALKPGQYAWFEDAAFARTSPRGERGITLVVSIPEQRAYLYRDGGLIAVSTVSTGKPGKDTPLGEFTILEKRVFHRSNLYSGAPMPFMQRLTWDGIALHAGHLPGYPASHGCIRLPKDFAKKLFGVTDLGVTVSVIDEIVVDPRYDRWGIPRIDANVASLGGPATTRVSLDRQPAPPSLLDAAQQSGSWVMGAPQEIVQPVPSTRR